MRLSSRLPLQLLLNCVNELLAPDGAHLGPPFDADGRINAPACKSPQHRAKFLTTLPSAYLHCELDVGNNHGIAIGNRQQKFAARCGSGWLSDDEAREEFALTQHDSIISLSK